MLELEAPQAGHIQKSKQSIAKNKASTTLHKK